MLRPAGATEPVASKLTLVPATTEPAEALTLAVGASAVTFTLVLPVDERPALSVTVTFCPAGKPENDPGEAVSALANVSVNGSVTDDDR